ncbi:DUF3891 family protein [Mesobacillus subterraneus]|nr:DUF3891 family protein [Mesobacillus subterraneus]
MIVYERIDEFVMVAQHDHAAVSQDAALAWRDDYFTGIERKKEVVLAVREHDRCWIEPDKTPLWNKKKQQPYSFMDYPGRPKLHFYKEGIDETVHINQYAGLLCSLHYASFLKDATSEIGKNFWNEENSKQAKLIIDLGIKNDQEALEELNFHLDLLKFCDNLSLYICLNEPGTPKQHEHYFYKNGIPQKFSFAHNKPIMPVWVDQKTVSLSVSPFVNSLHVSLPYRAVKKELIQKYGLVAAYKASPVLMREVTFI